MMRFKLLISLIAATLLLASCALIPPQPIGANALGYDGEEVSAGVAVAGFSQLASRSGTEQFPFQDIDPPDLPIGPSSLQAVQGFEPTVSVTGGVPLPETITINSGTLVVTVADDSGTPAHVTAEAGFGPFTLSKEPSCVDTICVYTFDDAGAAAKSLTVSISGDELSRLLQIITEGDPNTIKLDLTVETAEEVSSLTFTIDVEENYIRF